MIKRLVWFVSGLAAGAGGVVLLGKRIRKRMAALTPVRVADRGVQRVRSMALTARDAFGEGVAAMRHREQELRSRLDDRSPERSADSKVIVLRDAARPSQKSTSRRR